MNQLRTSRIISIGLAILGIFLLLSQFIFPQTGAGGGWCSPYLDAPQELGHSLYQFVSYGFPVQFVTVAKENCFSQQSTTYEWFLPGVVIDGLLLGIILFLWLRRLRKSGEFKHGY